MKRKYEVQYRAEGIKRYGGFTPINSPTFTGRKFFTLRGARAYMKWLRRQGGRLGIVVDAQVLRLS